MTQVQRGAQPRAAIDSLAVGMMVFITLSWGLNQVAIKVANSGYNPILLTVARSLVGGALVFMWCLWRRIPLFERDGTLVSGIIVGALFGFEFALIFAGLDYTTAARGTLMVNTMPFWVLVGAHFLLGERLTVQKTVGVALAFAGVCLVFSDKLSAPGPEGLIGDLMCLVAGMFWAATILVIKRSKLTSASAEKTLLYQLLVSAVILVPFVPLAGPLLRDVSTLATAAFLYQAVFVVAFTYVLWFWLMRVYPASGLSSFAFLTPAFGVLSGWLLLNEPLSVRIWAALLLIAAGILVVNRPVRR